MRAGGVRVSPLCPKRPRLAFRAGCPLVATLLVVVGLAVLARAGCHEVHRLPVYHRAAQQILAGNYELYPPEACGGTPHPSQGFRYAPAIAFLFFPLGWFGLETAALLFYVLKLVALWWVGTIIARRIGYTNWGRWTFLAAFLVVGGYLAEELRFGNAHFFVVMLMVIAFDRAEAGKVLTPALERCRRHRDEADAAGAAGLLRRSTPIRPVCGHHRDARGARIPARRRDGRRRQRAATERLPATPREKVDEGDNYSLRGIVVRHSRQA